MACQDTRPLKQPSQRHQVDDITDPLVWTQDSVDNHCHIDRSKPGRLRIAVSDSGRNQAILRREVNWTGTHLKAIVLDVANPSQQDTSIALAMQAGGTWFETESLPLPAGSRKDVHFPIASITHKQWPAKCSHIDRLMLLIKKAPSTITLHGAEALSDGPVFRQAQCRWEVLGAKVQGQSQIVVSYASTQVHAAPAKNKSAALENELAGHLLLHGSDGSPYRVEGFRSGIDADGRTRFHAVFSPPSPGIWAMELQVHDGQRLKRHPLPELRIDQVRRPWQIHPTDSTVLANGQGDSIWPVGQNLAWAGDPEPWLKELSENGGSLARVWICPWHTWLFAGNKHHAIDLKEAERLDHFFDLADTYQIDIILVLGYHGMLAGDWGRNPFNKKNGGSCAAPQEFWTNKHAATAYRRFLRYLCARWGAEARLAAWELWNEVDLTKRYRDQDIIQWHRQMATYLRSIDQHGHLITTSTAKGHKLTDLWQLEDIDIVQFHAYDQQLDRSMDAATRLTTATTKPVLLSEIGRDWRPAGDQADRAGRYLNQALWASWVMPVAGSAMPWWWDTHIAAQGHLAHFKNLATQIAGIDRSGQHFTTVSGQRELAGINWQLRGIIGKEQAHVLLSQPTASLERQGPATIPAGARVQLTGLTPGKWKVTIIPIGMPGNRTAIAISSTGMDGAASIPLPQSRGDIAIIALRQAPLAPGVGITVQADM